ncbi:hypothetical protein CLD22_10455 [Rubrivivax gelatinosus]|nr:hypothetical protein [Rubrivivax gelatinosus]
MLKPAQPSLHLRGGAAGSVVAPGLAKPAGAGLAVLAVVAGLLLAAIFGLAAAALPWIWMLGLVIVPVVLVLSIVYPVAGVVFALLFVFQVIPEQFHPRLPFGGGSLRVHDLMVVYLSAVVMIRTLATRAPLISPLQQFLWPLLYLFACIAISVVHVQVWAPNDRLLSEGRNLVAWMLLPLLVLGIRNQRALDWLWRSVFAIALVISVYVCLQTYADLQILGNVRDLAGSTTSANDAQGVQRSTAGGATYLIVLLLLLGINRAIEGRWPVWLATALGLLLVAALGASFGRGVWVATLFGVFVSAFVFRGLKAASLTVLMLALLVSCLLGLTAVVKPQVGEALVDRVTRFGDEVDRGGSFAWRVQENQDALRSIGRHSLLGVGIGGDYKQTTRAGASFQLETGYIHNAYLYFPVKLGLIGAFVPFAFIAAMGLAVRHALRLRPPRDRARVAALAGAFSTAALASVSQPEWTSLAGAAAFCTIMSLLLLESRYGDARSRDGSAENP